MSSRNEVNVKRVDDDEVEIDLLELFMELLNHWRQILLSAILVGAIALCYTVFMVTPLYTSTSILYVLSASTSITSVADIQIGTYLTYDYVEVVSGRPVLDQVIENLGLDMEYSTLSAKVSLENPDDSRLLKITVTDPDPVLAKEIADEIAEVSSQYIAEKMDQDAPSIIQYGYVATAKSSPSVKKNTMLGILAGAAAAILLVCISYLMNDTVMGPEDLEKHIGLNVLASLPKESDAFEGDDGKKHHKNKKKSA